MIGFLKRLVKNVSSISDNKAEVLKAAVNMLLVRKATRGMTVASALTGVIGLVGLILFGYFAYSSVSSGGYNTLQLLADGIGIVISAALMAVGFFTKLK
jgi:hypothetical protein